VGVSVRRGILRVRLPCDFNSSCFDQADGEQPEDGDPSHRRRWGATVPSSHLALAGQITYRRTVPSVGVPSDLLLRNKVKSSGCTQREWTK
jgi:hypothetical protein